MIFYQPLDGFSYNSDSLITYDFAKGFSPKGRVLDVGSGCGIVGLLLKREFDIELYSIEKQGEFCFFTTKNAEINSMSVVVYNGDFLDFEFNMRYDFIVSNPPFYAEGTQKSLKESVNIAKNSFNLPLYGFIKSLKNSIVDNGRVVFCYDAKYIQTISHILNEFSFSMECVRFVYPSFDKNSNLVLISAIYNSKCVQKVLQPVFVHKDKGVFSDEVKDIYKNSESYSIKCNIT